MAYNKKVPEEITCEIIKYLPFSKIMEILNTDNSLRKIFIKNINNIMNDFIEKYIDDATMYSLYNAFHHLYIPTDEPERKIFVLKKINNALCNNWKLNQNYNTIIKEFFDTHKIIPVFVKMFYIVHIIHKFPYDIALDAVSHMNMEKIHQMIIYAASFNDEDKYKHAYISVFEHNNDVYNSIPLQIKLFEQIVKRNVALLIDAASLAGVLQEQHMDEFFDLVDIGMEPQSASVIVNAAVANAHSSKTLNKAIKLVIKYDISVRFAIESIEQFTDEQMKIFKAFVSADKYLDESSVEYIRESSATGLKCLDYLVKHRLISDNNGEFFAEEQSDEHCQKVLDLVEQGIKFYKIINYMTLEKIDLLLNTLCGTENISLEQALLEIDEADVLQLNLYKDDENYVEAEYEENDDDDDDVYEYYTEEEESSDNEENGENGENGENEEND